MPAWIHCINCLSLTLFIVACHKSNLKVSFEVQFIVVPQVVEIKKKKKKKGSWMSAAGKPVGIRLVIKCKGKTVSGVSSGAFSFTQALQRWNTCANVPVFLHLLFPVVGRWSVLAIWSVLRLSCHPLQAAPPLWGALWGLGGYVVPLSTCGGS